MRKSLMLAVSALVTTFAASAAADQSTLKGAYGFTGSQACLVSILGFTPHTSSH